MKADWSNSPDPLAALQAGDLSPFERFVQIETTTFLGYFRRLGAGLDEAEDLTQELFLRLYRHADRYRPGARFEAFCFRIARNAWIDFERRRAVRPRAAAGTEEEDARDLEHLSPGDRQVAPDHAAELRDEAARLRAGLAELSAGHREVFELAVVQERPYPEISELLGIPVGTVKSRMHVAAKRLRAFLEEDSRPAADGDARRGPDRKQREPSA